MTGRRFYWLKGIGGDDCANFVLKVQNESANNGTKRKEARACES